MRSVLPSVTTALEAAGGSVRFVVAARDPHTRDLLAHMGYRPVDKACCATRWFPSSPDNHRYYARFGASIELMILQRARRVPVAWEAALEEFLRRVSGATLNWWLYGSAALAVRGIPVEPGDIDVRVDDAALAGRLFDDLLVTPVERLDGWVANYVGRAFHHAVIEWLSEPRADLDGPAAPSEQGASIEPHLETVHWHGYAVRVPPLSAQLRACVQRGLSDRVALIQAFCRARDSSWRA
jgi:hypothetical protein